MILKEALVGGTLYLDWIEEENNKPIDERVAFEYGTLSSKQRVELIHKTVNSNGIPDPIAVCKMAIDGNGKKVKNLLSGDGKELDTIEKILDYKNADLSLAYILSMIGSKIWINQMGDSQVIKN